MAAFRYVRDDLQKFKLSIRIRTKADLSDLESSMVVDANPAEAIFGTHPPKLDNRRLDKHSLT